MKISIVCFCGLVACCALALGNSPGAGVGSTLYTPAKDPSWYIKGIEQYVVLTEVQKQQITDIFEARAKEVTEFNQKNGERLKNLTQGLSDATAKNDGPRIMKLGEEYQALIKPMNDSIKKYNDKLDKVLTVEQKAKIKGEQLTKSIKSAAHPVELTEQQIKAVKAALGDSDNPTSIRAAVDDVLTPAQKTSVNRTRAVASIRSKFHAAKLTEEQIQQVEAAAEQIAKDTSLDAKGVAEKLSDKVEGLLTPEQKAAMVKAPKPGDMRSR